MSLTYTTHTPLHTLPFLMLIQSLNYRVRNIYKDNISYIYKWQ